METAHFARYANRAPSPPRPRRWFKRLSDVRASLSNSTSWIPTFSSWRSRAASSSRYRQAVEPSWSQIRVKILDPRSQLVRTWNKVFLVSCLVGAFVDPLFLYLPVINILDKCVQLDWALAVLLTALRSCTDFVYLLHIMMQFRMAYVSRGSRKFGRGELVKDPRMIMKHYLQRNFWLDLSAALPLPQIMVWIVIPAFTSAGGSTGGGANLVRLVVVVQYIPRLIRLIPLRETTSENFVGIGIFETAWSGFVLNLSMYFLAAHVAGALFYIFALERTSHCWQLVCEDEQDLGCDSEYFSCSAAGRDSWANATSIVPQCSSVTFDQNLAIQSPNQTFFDYGIFVEVLRISSDTIGLKKYLLCFWWGLRNISSFGNNLIPTIFVGEILFCIAIGVGGMCLLALLVGNMQSYLEGLTRRTELMRLKRRHMERWMAHRQLPLKLRRLVHKYIRYEWAATQGVDEQALLKNLPHDLRRDIKRSLCLNLVTKVPQFAACGDSVTDEILEALYPVLFIKDMRVVQEGEPVRRMLFILRGGFGMSTRRGDPATAPSSLGILRPGDFCGEELLTWVEGQRRDETDSNRAGLPAATATITALVATEAYALRADDLLHATANVRWPRRRLRQDSNGQPGHEDGGSENGKRLPAPRDPHDVDAGYPHDEGGDIAGSDPTADSTAIPSHARADSTAIPSHARADSTAIPSHARADSAAIEPPRHARADSAAIEPPRHARADSAAIEPPRYGRADSTAIEHPRHAPVSISPVDMPALDPMDGSAGPRDKYGGSREDSVEANIFHGLAASSSTPRGAPATLRDAQVVPVGSERPPTTLSGADASPATSEGGALLSPPQGGLFVSRGGSVGRSTVGPPWRASPEVSKSSRHSTPRRHGADGRNWGRLGSRGGEEEGSSVAVSSDGLTDLLGGVAPAQSSATSGTQLHGLGGGGGAFAAGTSGGIGGSVGVSGSVRLSASEGGIGSPGGLPSLVELTDAVGPGPGRTGSIPVWSSDLSSTQHPSLPIRSGQGGGSSGVGDVKPLGGGGGDDAERLSTSPRDIRIPGGEVQAFRSQSRGWVPDHMSLPSYATPPPVRSSPGSRGSPLERGYASPTSMQSSPGSMGSPLERGSTPTAVQKQPAAAPAVALLRQEAVASLAPPDQYNLRDVSSTGGQSFGTPLRHSSGSAGPTVGGEPGVGEAFAAGGVTSPTVAVGQEPLASRHQVVPRSWRTHRSSISHDSALSYNPSQRR